MASFGEGPALSSCVGQPLQDLQAKVLGFYHPVDDQLGSNPQQVDILVVFRLLLGYIGWTLSLGQCLNLVVIDGVHTWIIW